MKIFSMLIITIVALSGLLRAEDFGKHLFILSGHSNMACFNSEGYETLGKRYVEAAGRIGVEIQEANGKPFPGFALQDCPEIFGDEIERTVVWKKNAAIRKLAGKAVRLRFVLKDADLYSFCFGNSSNGGK